MKPPPTDEKTLLKQGYRQKYGAWFPPIGGRQANDLRIEFICFGSPKLPSQSPGRYAHCKNIINTIWNNPDSPEKFEFHPWSEWMLQNLCTHNYLAVAGGASTGKTQTGGLWAILRFMRNPYHTKVLVTSTDLKASRERVWGVIEKYWRAAAVVLGGEENLPGMLVSSAGMIKGRTGDNDKDATRGISLVAGEASKAAESTKKMQGIKGGDVVLVADELPELSEAILNTAESNLFANPNFSLVAMGNPNSYFDPFGRMAEPKDGWDSLREDHLEWETKLGYCIRFDGERSPNIKAGKTLYPYLMTEERLAEFRSRLGEKSLNYYRMVKGFWCPTGSVDSVLSEADLRKHHADARVKWAEPPVLGAGFDPAFTNDGDKSVLLPFKIGLDMDGKRVVEFQEPVALFDDVENKGASRTEQIIGQLRSQCQRMGIPPTRLAIDSTGAGKPFCDMVRAMWGGGVLEVSFAGRASALPASGTDGKRSDEVYVNRVTELWYTMREYVMSGQVKGLTGKVARDLTGRTYESKERGKVVVESKKDMRGRLGRSPDYGDAAALGLCLCRERLGLASKLRPKKDDYAYAGVPKTRGLRVLTKKLFTARNW